MPLANEQDAYYLGSTAVTALYAGDVKVWPASPPPPSQIDVHTEGAVLVKFAAATTGGSGFTVDWGDGTPVQSFVDGAGPQHTYAGAGPWTAAVTPVAGAMRGFTIPSSSQFTSATAHVALTEFGSHAAVTGTAVQHLYANVPVTPATCLSMFNGMGALQTVPDIDSTGVADFTAMFGNCTALTTFPLFDTSSGTTFLNMCIGCRALTSIPVLDLSSAANLTGMFADCTALAAIPALDLSSATKLADMFRGCPLTSIAAFGARYSISVLNADLDAPALNTFFGNLGTAAGAQTVTITGNPGAATCDRTIATNKGWTVTG